MLTHTGLASTGHAACTSLLCVTCHASAVMTCCSRLHGGCGGSDDCTPGSCCRCQWATGCVPGLPVCCCKGSPWKAVLVTLVQSVCMVLDLCCSQETAGKLLGPCLMHAAGWLQLTWGWLLGHESKYFRRGFQGSNPHVQRMSAGTALWLQTQQFL